MVPGTN